MNRPLPFRKVPEPPATFAKRVTVRGVDVDQIDDSGLRTYLRRLINFLTPTNRDVIEQLNGQVQGSGPVINATGVDITIVPTAASHIVIGSGSIKTIEAPDQQVGVEDDHVTERRVTNFTGPIWLLPEIGATWTLVTGGNIKKASSCVAGRHMLMWFDGENWWPSY